MKKILIIEDDPKIALALSTRMKSAGYEGHAAYDAITGLDLAVKIRPDAVLLDISMPAGNGFEVAERIQKRVPIHVPIIFITASKQDGFREKATQLGAAAYLEKPYEPEVLMAAVKKAVGE